jgi:hypothetical protein
MARRDSTFHKTSAAASDVAVVCIAAEGAWLVEARRPTPSCLQLRRRSPLVSGLPLPPVRVYIGLDTTRQWSLLLLLGARLPSFSAFAVSTSNTRVVPSTRSSALKVTPPLATHRFAELSKARSP